MLFRSRKMNIADVSEDAEDNDREDDEDWDVWDGNGDSSIRVHNDSFHKFNNKPWDLGINSLYVEDSSDSDDDDMDSDEKDAEYTANMPDMRTIRKLDKSFSDFAELDDGVKGKRTKLLSERHGLTQLNLGYDVVVMADILHPYIVLTKRLQTKGRAISHRVRFWYSEFFRRMNVTFMGDNVDGPTWGKC